MFTSHDARRVPMPKSLTNPLGFPTFAESLRRCPIEARTSFRRHFTSFRHRSGFMSEPRISLRFSFIRYAMCSPIPPSWPLSEALDINIRPIFLVLAWIYTLYGLCDPGKCSPAPTRQFIREIGPCFRCFSGIVGGVTWAVGAIAGLPLAISLSFFPVSHGL